MVKQYVTTGDIMEEELVSVIIPVYNREKTIKKSIDSILNQTYSNLEIIVVDDCSLDGSRDVVKSYKDKRVRLIACEENKGANHARNLGISLSKGNYIAFNDSDDEWTDDKLEIQLNYMKENNLAVSFSPYIIKETGMIIPENYSQLTCDTAYVKAELRAHNVIGTPTLVLSKAVVEDIGMFDEEMPRLQDYEYVIRIVEKYEIGCCPNILLKVGTGGGRISTNDKRLDIATGMILKKHISFFDKNTSFLLKNMFTNDNHEFEKSIFEDIINDKQIRDAISLEGIKISKSYIETYSERSRLLNRINFKRLKSGEFIIYGAGERGKKLYKELKQNGLLPKYFIVSNKSDNDTVIDNILIKDVHDIKEREMIVIVAVALETQIDILRTLQELSFDNVITI